MSGILAAQSALAADSLSVDEEIRHRQAEEAKARQSVVEQPHVSLTGPAPVAADAPWPAEQPCFVLRTVVLDGSGAEGWLRADPFDWLRTDLQQYVGRCVGEQGLQRIVREAGNALLQRGFTTTRIGLAAQDISAGVLHLKVMPGRVRAIRFREPVSINLDTAFPIQPGQVLNLRDIEQGLEQVRSLASQDIDIDIVPADEAGWSDLVVTGQVGRRWHAGLTLDNSGSRSTGLHQLSGSLAWDAPLGLNDALSLSLNQDAERDGMARGTRGSAISYSLPIGYWTAALNASRYSYHQMVTGSNQSFLSTGRSANEEFRLARVVWRGQAGKTTLQLKLARRRSQSFIDDTEIEAQRRDTSSSEWAVLHRQQLGPAQLDVQLADRRGRPWWGGQRDLSDHEADTPTFGFGVQSVDLNLNWPFKLADQAMSWSSNLRGQTSRNRLYATEQFSIGSRYTVRGFDGEQTLSGERGWVWRNEWALPLGQSNQSLFAAYDVGGVGGVSTTEMAERYLSGAALGLRGGWHGLPDAQSGISYECSVGYAIRRPDTLTTRQPVLAFQISYQF